MANVNEVRRTNEACVRTRIYVRRFKADCATFLSINQPTHWCMIVQCSVDSSTTSMSCSLPLSFSPWYRAQTAVVQFRRRSIILITFLVGVSIETKTVRFNWFCMEHVCAPDTWFNKFPNASTKWNFIRRIRAGIDQSMMYAITINPTCLHFNYPHPFCCWFFAILFAHSLKNVFFFISLPRLWTARSQKQLNEQNFEYITNWQQQSNKSHSINAIETNSLGPVEMMLMTTKSSPAIGKHAYSMDTSNGDPTQHIKYRKPHTSLLRRRHSLPEIIMRK